MRKTGIEPCEGFTPHGCGGLFRGGTNSRRLEFTPRGCGGLCQNPTA